MRLQLVKKTWNLEHGTLNLIELPADCCQLLGDKGGAGLLPAPPFACP